MHLWGILLASASLSSLGELVPTPAVSLRFRRFKRGLGIAAPKVVVRSVWPRYFVLLFVGFAFLALAGGTALVLGWLRSDPEVAELRRQLEQQQTQLSAFKSLVDTGENTQSMERAKEHHLLQRMRELEQENAVLKEDLLIFERLLPLGGGDSLAKVENFRVVRTLAGEYQYRLLLAFQSSKRGEYFRGDYELYANIRMADGLSKMLQFPDKSERGIEIKHFLRREGRFVLPDGAVLISVEARLTQGGKLLSSQSVAL